MNPFCKKMLQNVRFMQNESILQNDESCKMHFSPANCDVLAKRIHFSK